MAVSPAFTLPASSAANNAVTKAKALTILKAPHASEKASTSSNDIQIDLAEQINENVRRKYEKIDKLGEGTYANVYRYCLRSDPAQLFAIKKIKVIAEFRDGLTMDSIREVRFLQELSHPNIIRLYDVFTAKDQNLNLVLEILPGGDLEQLMQDHNVLYGAADVKAWMGMLCQAVWFCHENFVLHRDIKLNNLLIAGDGAIRLADFGLARSFGEPGTKMSVNVVTRWYRCPELLLGTRSYGGAVDIWSVGVVFGELVLRRFWMPSETDVGQLDNISRVFGTPTEENWPGVSRLPDYRSVDQSEVHRGMSKNEWDTAFGSIGPVGIDLLKKMMILDPRKRFTAKQILNHEWWKVDPRPTRNQDLPRKGGGLKKIGEDLKRRGGELEDRPVDKVARKLDFSAMKK